MRTIREYINLIEEYSTDGRKIWPGGIAEFNPTYHKAGITLYHGTSYANLPKVMRSGLQPRNTSHTATMYHDWRKLTQDKPELQADKPPLDLKAVYTSPNIEEVRTYMFPVILSFVTTSEDILSNDHYQEGEILVHNKVAPDRLKMVQGKPDRMQSLLDKETAADEAGVPISASIKNINQAIKSTGYKLSKASRKTDRVKVTGPERQYGPSDWQVTNDYGSFLLKSEGPTKMKELGLPWDPKWLTY